MGCYQSKNTVDQSDEIAKPLPITSPSKRSCPTSESLSKSLIDHKSIVLASLESFCAFMDMASACVMVIGDKKVVDWYGHNCVRQDFDFKSVEDLLNLQTFDCMTSFKIMNFHIENHKLLVCSILDHRRHLGGFLIATITDSQLSHIWTLHTIQNATRLLSQDVIFASCKRPPSENEIVSILNSSNWHIVWCSIGWRREFGASNEKTQLWDLFEDNSKHATASMKAIKQSCDNGNVITLNLISIKSRISMIMSFERLCDARYLLETNVPYPMVDTPNTGCDLMIVKPVSMSISDAKMLVVSDPVNVKKNHVSSNAQVKAQNLLSSMATSDHENELSQIKIGRELGKGGYGIVYHANWRGEEVALKILEQPSIDPANLFSDEIPLPIKAIQEAEIAQTLTHENVVKTWKAITRQVGDRVQTWIIMEFCRNGSLRQQIDKGYFGTIGKNNSDMNKIVKVLKDVAEGMTYLHEKNIVHGDLCGNNVLFAENFTAKISDFGLSRAFENGTVETQTYGTVGSMPNELLSRGILSKKADVYAFGVLMYELYTCQRAWSGLRHAQVIMQKINYKCHPLTLSENAPTWYIKLFEDCMAFEYQNRPSFENVLSILNEQPIVTIPA